MYPESLFSIYKKNNCVWSQTVTVLTDCTFQLVQLKRICLITNGEALKTRLREENLFFISSFLTFLLKTADRYWQILKMLEWDYIDRDSRMGRYFHFVIVSVTGAKKG